MKRPAEFQGIVAFKNRHKRVIGTVTVDLKKLPKRRRRVSFLARHREKE